ncbi:hybrid signal transduction histidine kinase M [Tanacetum coccineum]
MTEVKLHIYDVTNSDSEKTNNTIVQINKIFKDGIGLGGIFHSAVQGISDCPRFININSLIPDKLDLAESNYYTWSYFFKGRCSNFGVLKHIEEPVTEASTSTPPTDEWITADSIVKSWIFFTLSSTLRKRLIKANPKTAKAAWDAIETIFHQQRTHLSLKRRITGSISNGRPKLRLNGILYKDSEAILTLLTDLGSDMSDDDDDVVTYAINGLSDKYGSLAQIIAHKDPFPDLATVRSMVATEELRLRSRSSVLPTGTTSSAPN